ncbi:MAG: 2-dehydropantoate 2-reductase [Thermoplasmata archaeon]|nr:2-dehydropantoate 2-reductase [Thermoplasmata archaeon]
MKILVYGAGALGSLLGGLLAEGHEVVLLSRREHAEAVNAHGLVLSGVLAKVVHPRAITELSALDMTPELVLLTVKSYDTVAACECIVANMGPTPVVGFQNGLGNLEAMKRILWPNKAYGATTTMGATLIGPGNVLFAGEGTTRLEAARKEDTAVLGELAEGLRKGGAVERAENITQAIWDKAAVNIGINYLTALAGVENGVLASHWEELRGLVAELLSEVACAAEQTGVQADPERWAEAVLDVASSTSSNRSSMLQDLERGKRTENDALAGEVLRRGQGCSLPGIHTLYSLVRLAEARTTL